MEEALAEAGKKRKKKSCAIKYWQYKEAPQRSTFTNVEIFWTFKIAFSNFSYFFQY